MNITNLSTFILFQAPYCGKLYLLKKAIVHKKASLNNGQTDI